MSQEGAERVELEVLRVVAQRAEAFTASIKGQYQEALTTGKALRIELRPMCEALERWREVQPKEGA